ncbi:AAA family ATPase [Tissierella carlieri]|uniref:AAA family ATPase n=1 Tax=Tissierella carlieri TaxID=689904 RepID=A0ABT1S7U9_9FIRM|nr:magnesium chelatase subunit D family protein [Tissierella carlieri]MCQ4922534.1 AAA family ATPase [Tissierella carlieri]
MNRSIILSKKQYCKYRKVCDLTMFDNCFPFSAVLGQERIKMALILNLINPYIGGVLISGEKGTAKSTLIRGLSAVVDYVEVVELPLNVTEDRLVGSIDIKKAIRDGEKKFEEGILYKAHKQILYVDEINLLSEHIVNILLEVLSTGTNIVEREGISYSHPSDFILVGSMNPEEGILRPQLLDKFGLYVEAKGETDIDNRIEIIKRFLDYERNPSEFYLKWEKENRAVQSLIYRGRTIIKDIKVKDEDYNFAVDLSRQGNCSGNRAEIILIETAKAIVAFNQRYYVTQEDIRDAASYVLPHRIKEPITVEEMEEFLDENMMENNNARKEDYEEYRDDYDPNKGSLEETINTATKEETLKESIEDIIPIAQDISINMEFGKKNSNKGSGKRSKVKTDSHKGRYVRYKLPKGKANDIAFDATFRIAAFNQKNRNKRELAVCIKPQDIREKVREKHTGATILFAVDASGSMGARRRMGAVKGAVLSLLKDAYQKRDSIGIIAFRKDRAEILLNITRSVDLAEKCLRKLPTGGKTPLAAGLYTSYQILKADKIKNPDSLQYLIIVSDGKANVPFKTENPLEDAFILGEKIRNEGIKTMVIDTEKNYIEYGFAKELAKKMNGEYIKISQLSKNDVETSVKSLLNIN